MNIILSGRISDSRREYALCARYLLFSSRLIAFNVHGTIRRHSQFVLANNELAAVSTKHPRAIIILRSPRIANFFLAKQLDFKKKSWRENPPRWWSRTRVSVPADQVIIIFHFPLFSVRKKALILSRPEEAPRALNSLSSLVRSQVQQKGWCNGFKKPMGERTALTRSETEERGVKAKVKRRFLPE